MLTPNTRTRNTGRRPYDHGRRHGGAHAHTAECGRRLATAVAGETSMREQQRQARSSLTATDENRLEEGLVAHFAFHVPHPGHQEASQAGFRSLHTRARRVTDPPRGSRSPAASRAVSWPYAWSACYARGLPLRERPPTRCRRFLNNRCVETRSAKHGGVIEDARCSATRSRNHGQIVCANRRVRQFQAPWRSRIGATLD